MLCYDSLFSNDFSLFIVGGGGGGQIIKWDLSREKKTVFWGFWPGKTQIGLLTYRD